jgi:hypothetical protein
MRVLDTLQQTLVLVCIVTRTALACTVHVSGAERRYRRRVDILFSALAVLLVSGCCFSENSNREGVLCVAEQLRV